MIALVAGADLALFPDARECYCIAETGIAFVAVEQRQ
jgi:hypothetical protein